MKIFNRSTTVELEGLNREVHKLEIPNSNLKKISIEFTKTNNRKQLISVLQETLENKDPSYQRLILLKYDHLNRFLNNKESHSKDEFNAFLNSLINSKLVTKQSAKNFLAKFSIQNPDKKFKDNTSIKNVHSKKFYGSNKSTIFYLGKSSRQTNKGIVLKSSQLTTGKPKLSLAFPNTTPLELLSKLSSKQFKFEIKDGILFLTDKGQQMSSISGKGLGTKIPFNQRLALQEGDQIVIESNYPQLPLFKLKMISDDHLYMESLGEILVDYQVKDKSLSQIKYNSVPLTTILDRFFPQANIAKQFNRKQYCPINFELTERGDIVVKNSGISYPIKSLANDHEQVGIIGAQDKVILNNGEYIHIEPERLGDSPLDIIGDAKGSVKISTSYKSGHQTITPWLTLKNENGVLTKILG